VARGEHEEDPPPPPTRLIPLLGFRGRLAERTIDTVREVLALDEEFRIRVEAALSEHDPVSDLLLRRPPGWEAEFEALVDAAESEGARRSDELAQTDAARRVDALSERLARSQQDLSRIRADLDRVNAELAGERRKRAGLQRRIDQHDAAIDAAREDRDRAVSELSTTRMSMAALREELEAVRRGDDAETQAVLERRREAVETARSVLGQVLSQLGAIDDGLGELVADLVADLVVDHRAPDEPAPTVPAATGSAATGSTRRRRPQRLVRGAVEGTPAGVDQLLRSPGALVVVDGYNLAMAVWRSLSPAELRDRTVGFLTDVRSRTGADVVVVFDGGEVGERLAVAAPVGVRTMFSPTGVEADDVIIDLMAKVPAEQPVVVVSSDRRVRDGVRRQGANVIRSEELWAWSQALASG
jgi:predicted RNA-binding protein with PIN domain